MNAMSKAETAPMSREPTKMSRKRPQELKTSSPAVLSPSPAITTVWYITIPMASLKMDSPKIMAFKSTSASISLKMAITETGSVALIRLPKAKASRHVNSGEASV